MMSNVRSWRLRRAALAIATIGSDGGGFGMRPPVVEYSRKFQARAVEDLRALPDGSAIGEMLSDYAVMREQARSR